MSEENQVTVSTPAFSDDIVETYNLLANQPTDYANALMERQAQAQASYGPLAEQVMGMSRTPEQGVGNYTYNRLVRPAVDVMRDEMIVRGLSDALNRQLKDSLNRAKRNYSKAANKNSNKNKTEESDGVTIEDELIEDNSGTKVGRKEFAGSGEPVKEGDPGTASNLTEEQLENIRNWAKLWQTTHNPDLYYSTPNSFNSLMMGGGY